MGNVDCQSWLFRALGMAPPSNSFNKFAVLRTTEGNDVFISPNRVLRQSLFKTSWSFKKWNIIPPQVIGRGFLFLVDPKPVLFHESRLVFLEAGPLHQFLLLELLGGLAGVPQQVSLGIVHVVLLAQVAANPSRADALQFGQDLQEADEVFVDFFRVQSGHDRHAGAFGFQQGGGDLSDFVGL